MYAQGHVAHVQKMGLEDGLSSYNVEGFLQDRQGYIWLATDYGLNRFDGRQFKVYTQEENGLCGNSILKIHQDGNGMLWVLTGDRGSLNFSHCIFDPIKEEFQDIGDYLGFKPPFDPQHTYSYLWMNGAMIFEERNQKTESSVIYEFDGKRIRKVLQLSIKGALCRGRRIEQVCKTGPNEFALQLISELSEEGSICFFDSSGNVIREFVCPAVTPNMLGVGFTADRMYANCVAENENWQLQVVEKDTAVFKNQIPIKAGWEERFTFANGRLYSLFRDSLRCYDINGKLVETIYTGLDLPIIFWGKIFADDQGNLWTPGAGNLICISLVPKWFQSELYDKHFPRRLRGITQSKAGELFTVEIDHGYSQQPNQQWEVMPGIVRNYLGIISQDSLLWLGSEYASLCSYNPKTSRIKEYPTRLDQGNGQATLVWMPHLTQDGTLWAGSNHGIYRLDVKSGQLIPFGGGKVTPLSNGTVYAFHENAMGTWLSTSVGLFLVDLSKEVILGQYGADQQGEHYLPATHFAHLHEDEQGIFWMATKGSGLLSWNPEVGEYQQFTQQGAGLAHNVLYAVYGDDFGNLWISSQNGLMRFSKDNEFVQIFRVADGLPNNEFNTISHYQAPDGELFFGGQNGMIHFHPRQFQQGQRKPTVLITGCQVQNRATDSLQNVTAQLLQDQTLTLHPEDKALILQFVLLDYHNSKNHQYSYRIEGYDREWVFLDGNQVKISNLPFGKYQLRLRAKAADGNAWIEYPQSIRLNVSKPFYFQGWFIVLLIVLIVGLIYAGIRLRTRTLEQRKKELEQQVEERTLTIEEDKKIIEADKLRIEQQAEELKSLDKLKSRFFANISHELRTPLTLILGPLSFLLDHPEAMEETTVRQQLLVMQRNGKSLLQLVEEILDISKMDAQKLELKEEATPVKLFFETLAGSFVPQFQNQEIGFRCEFHLPTEELELNLDRKKMEKVVNNFLSNALKFTPKGGQISLAIGTRGQYLQLKVQDNGRGIHPKDLPHVFERFYQTRHVDLTYAGGTGIGLALVKEYATLMGGHTYVESELGEGSTFHFEIPMQVVAVSLHLPQVTASLADFDDDAPTESIGSDFTILVVEDHPEMRKYIAELLQLRFKEVIEAQNGAEAVERLEELGTGIHLIVSDVMMPEIDGLALLKRVKSHPEWHRIPMIMLTALAEDRDRLDALVLGVDDYLTKPFSSAELIVRAQNLLYNYHQRGLGTGQSPEGDSEDNEADETSENESQMPIAETDRAYLQKVQGFILASIPHKIPDVVELADEACLSPRQLTRKIKHITGLTPGRFIREVQLQFAREQIETNAVLSVKEVTFRAGFEQASTFSSLYKKRFGVSPSVAKRSYADS